ncbi:MAG TPA: helix-turn-helix domain-containing protein, partial [Desulfosarcina sp.]|nr:helix-turn-helix domain-containing protein [Desulfosarcina sp.]
TTWRRLRGQPDAVQPPVAGAASDGIGGMPPNRPQPSPADPGRPAGGAVGPEKGLLAAQADHERSVLAEALAHHGGNITRAARSIGISRQLFNYKMKKYRIDRRDYLR